MPFLERDAWVDAALGLTDIPADDPRALPGDGVPYLPASVDSILAFINHSGVGPGDLVVDVGSGLGRVCALVHLLTGARCVGLELQPGLIARAPRLEGVRYVCADAVEATRALGEATHFFLYCPFSGPRLERWVDALPRTRDAWVGCVDFPLPRRDWLARVATPSAELELWRAALRPASSSS